MLYEKLNNSNFRLIIPIKSKNIGSPYGGMPQFFGGGALPGENFFQTINRELCEESYSYIHLNGSAQLNLVHNNTLKIDQLKIDFSFYISSDFKHNFKSLPFVATKNGEMATIAEFILSKNMEINSENMCKKLDIIPSVHFQRSETFKAFDIALKKFSRLM